MTPVSVRLDGGWRVQNVGSLVIVLKTQILGTPPHTFVVALLPLRFVRVSKW